MGMLTAAVASVAEAATEEAEIRPIVIAVKREHLRFVMGVLQVKSLERSKKDLCSISSYAL